MIDQNYMTNMIFYGPPGTGKTTAAKIIAGLSGMELFMLNATSATLADVQRGYRRHEQHVWPERYPFIFR